MLSKTDIPFYIIQLIEKVKGRLFAFTRRYRLEQADLKQQPFFIVGCGRSGNTLLRAMLVAGNQVVIPPESYVIPRVVRLFSSFSYLPWSQLSSIVIAEFEAFKEFHTWGLDLSTVHKKVRELDTCDRSLASIIDLIYREYANKNKLPMVLWGDKTPKNSVFLEHITAVYPQAKFIHVIRDPRAVLSSYLKSSNNQNDLNNDTKQIIQFWLKANQKHLKNRQKLAGQCITVHYENLIHQPEVELTKITKFLGVSYSDKMLDFSNIDTLGDVNHYNHHASVLKPLTKDNLECWKNELSQDNIKLVEKHCLSLYNQLCRQYPLVKPTF